MKSKIRYFKLTSVLLVALLFALSAACGGETGDAGLVDTSWRLASIDGEPPLEGTELTLNFESGTELTGQAGCNSFGGTYTVGSDGPLNEASAPISISNLVQTEVACMEPEGVMEQESTYLGILGNAGEVRLMDGQLTITSANGRILIFEKE